jgi:glycyl-tRNA synthetase beta subunit
MSTAPAPAEPAKSVGEKALGAVPIVLTVLATILAGLSSSEMTQSMYFRSLAAQNQSKAGSQWAFFQAKRVRGTTMESGGDLIRALADPPPLDAVRLRSDLERIETMVRKATDAQPLLDAVNRLKQILGRDSIRQSLKYISGSDLPPVADNNRTPDEQIQALQKAIEARKTEAQTVSQVLEISTARIEIALEQAEGNAAAFDDVCKPITTDMRTLEKAVSEIGAEARKLQAATMAGTVDEAANVVKEMAAGLRAAKQDFTARRYAKEAAYNQESAELYEIMVRRTGAESDRHRTRSKNFFYAMLCAQAGVTVAAFALARSQKNWFWAVAGTAGLIAISFGAYVYVAI